MRPVKTFDKERVSLNLARLRKGGEIFEIVIDPDKIIEYRKGKIDDVRVVIHSEQIFNDAKKGMLASEHRLVELLGTDDSLQVCKIILDEGEIQFTQEYRQQIREDKLNKITDIICRNAVDPRTHLPHPRTRIENAMSEARIKVDEIKDAEDQVQEIVDKLRSILPIKLAIKEIQVKFPATYAGKAYSSVARYAKIISENWQSDGSWIGIVEIPAGIQNEFFDALNKLTKGEVETKILKEK